MRSDKLTVLLLVSILTVGLCAIQKSYLRAQENHNLSKWATIEAHDRDVPVYAFGYTYVYGVSPDYKTNLVLQEGNDAPARKIQPKKSWEIRDSYFGSTPAREPRTAANDDQPLLGVHLIDGDVLSTWSSRGQNQPSIMPEWIRIDLPQEALVDRVVLVGHPEGMGRGRPLDPASRSVRVGQAFPHKLEIRTSRDAWHWDTVYKNDSYTPQDIKGRNVISFDPRIAKQIWIIGSDLPLTHYFSHCFSIAGAEVLDTKGENLALVSRGAGVQVSSTHTGFAMDRFTQDMLWPTQYDLGFKWSRVGYDMSLFQWAYVEREKGKLHVDDRADAVITEAVKNGTNIVMSLDKGNWLYAPKPKMLDRTRDLMETYSTDPGKVTAYESMLQGYLNYVRFMVRHFKGRVKIFELWNVWGGYTYEEGKEYAQLLRLALPIIREEDPQAKIMPASPGWLEKGDEFGFFRALGEQGLLSKVDVIGFHPFYNPSVVDPYLTAFPADFARLKNMVEGYGFRGQYMVSEWDFHAAYPPSDLPPYVQRVAYSEIQKAVYAARLAITFAHLDLINLWNETFQTMHTYEALGLFRNTWPNEVICPTQPEPVYYMLRTLGTALQDVKGADIPVTFSNTRRQVESYGFVRGDGEKLIAFWLPGVMLERGGIGSTISPFEPPRITFVTDLAIKGPSRAIATLIDVLNGTEKPLNVEQTSDGTVIRKIHVQDWPLIIRLQK